MAENIGYFFSLDWLFKSLQNKSGDLSKHRLHTAKYEDLCM